MPSGSYEALEFAEGTAGFLRPARPVRLFGAVRAPFAACAAFARRELADVVALRSFVDNEAAAESTRRSSDECAELLAISDRSRASRPDGIEIELTSPCGTSDAEFAAVPALEFAPDES